MDRENLFDATTDLIASAEKARLELYDLEQGREQDKTVLALIESKIYAEVSEAEDGGKKLYTNDATRKSEQAVRLSQHKNYQTLKEEFCVSERPLIEKRLRIDALNEHIKLANSFLRGS